MSLVPLDESVRDRFGPARPNQAFYIYEHGTTDEVALYGDPDGLIPLTQPLVSDNEGRYTRDSVGHEFVVMWGTPGLYDKHDPADALNPTVPLIIPSAGTVVNILPARPTPSTAGRLFFDTVGGDLYVDTGAEWVRIGEPQLAYAQSFLAGNQQGATSATWADIAGIATGDFEVANKPIMAVFDCAYVYVSVANVVGGIRLVDGDGVVRAGPWYFGSAGGGQASIQGFRRGRTLSSLDPGTYELKAQMHNLFASGTAYVVSDHQGSSDPDVGQPVSLRVMEV